MKNRRIYRLALLVIALPFPSSPPPPMPKYKFEGTKLFGVKGVSPTAPIPFIRKVREVSV